MQMLTHPLTHTFRHATLALALAAALSPATAADFSFSGQIRFHNDKVFVDFSLAAPATNVRIWTDSWLAGINFDPAAALWQAGAGGVFNRLAEVDDDNTVNPATQGFYDTGFSLPNLAAGNYRVSVVAAFNATNGNLLSQGFAYDAQTPILLTDWTQPSADPNFGDQKGGVWRLNLSGVTQAAVVPEPQTWLLMALGFGLIGLTASRARRHG
jgi:PEP-CTERM motif